MSSRSRIIEVSVLILTGTLVYLGSLDVPFIFDDLSAIVMNPTTYNLQAAFGQIFSLRGVTYFTFALNHAWSGLDVWSWHLVNLAIHLGSTVLVYLLLCRFFDQERWLPLFGALFFLAHPLQTQAVTYLVQRMASLSALLVLSSVYGFVRAREIYRDNGNFFKIRHLLWYGGGLAAGLVAVLAKENAASLPLLLLLTAWVLNDGRAGLRREAVYLAPVWCTVVVAALYLVVHSDILNQSLEHLELFTSADPPWIEKASSIPAVRWKYLATQSAVFWIYLKLLIFPWGQRLDYSYPLAQNLFELRILFGLAGLALLTLGTALSRNRYLLFALLWFLCGLMIESSILPLEPVFEHRLYLPMFGVTVALCELWRRYLPERAGKGAAIALIVVLCLLTVARNQLWRDPVRLWTDNLAKVPYSFRIKFVLSEALRKNGQEQEAYALVEQVMQEKLPRSVIESELFWDKMISLGQAQLRFGRTADAVATFRKAVGIFPDDATANFHLGTAYVALGNKKKARLCFDRAKLLDPQNRYHHEYPVLSE